jgi:hypothetical protein
VRFDLQWGISPCSFLLIGNTAEQTEKGLEMFETECANCSEVAKLFPIDPKTRVCEKCFDLWVKLNRGEN